MKKHVDCPFCNPDYVLVEAEYSRIIVNLKPGQFGHILAVPKRHVSRVSELTMEEWLDLAMVEKHAADILEIHCSQQLNLLLNQGPDAGQTLEHLHKNLIPRHEGDNFVNMQRVLKDRSRISEDDIARLRLIF